MLKINSIWIIFFFINISQRLKFATEVLGHGIVDQCSPGHLSTGNHLSSTYINVAFTACFCMKKGLLNDRYPIQYIQCKQNHTQDMKIPKNAVYLDQSE